MLKFFDFGENIGCFWVALHVGLFIWAVLCVATGEATPFEWSVIIGEIMHVLLFFLGRWVERRRDKRNYIESKEKSLAEQKSSDKQGPANSTNGQEEEK